MYFSIAFCSFLPNTSTSLFFCFGSFIRLHTAGIKPLSAAVSKPSFNTVYISLTVDGSHFATRPFTKPCTVSFVTSHSRIFPSSMLIWFSTSEEYTVYDDFFMCFCVNSHFSNQSFTSISEGGLLYRSFTFALAIKSFSFASL